MDFNNFNDPGFNINLVGLNSASNIDNIKPSALIKKAKAKIHTVNKTYILKDILPEFPKPGFYYHIITGANFDFYNLVPLFIDIYKKKIDHFIVSTWSIFDIYILDICKRFDEGQIKKIDFISSFSFARRFPVAHGSFLEQLTARKQTYTTARNHAKITMMKIGKNYIVAEGSPNFTQNPRIEQFVVCNDKEVFDFHFKWINQIIKDKIRV